VLTILMIAPLPMVFLLGVALGWHARPDTVVEVPVTDTDPLTQARDNQIVWSTLPRRGGGRRG
jgi:hypothetical protein